jgi:hypothetical protein
MLMRTIQVGSYQLVQGEFLKELGDGQISVQVYDRVFVGRPVDPYLRSAEPAAPDAPGDGAHLAG